MGVAVKVINNNDAKIRQKKIKQNEAIEARARATTLEAEARVKRAKANAANTAKAVKAARDTANNNPNPNNNENADKAEAAAVKAAKAVKDAEDNATKAKNEQIAIEVSNILLNLLRNPHVQANKNKVLKFKEKLQYNNLLVAKIIDKLEQKEYYGNYNFTYCSTE